METADSFYVAHVGDGGALITTGDRGTRLNPLFSHANRAGALTQYLGMPRDTVTPGIISIPKVFDVGQLILSSTDGLLPTGRGKTLATSLLIVDEVQG